MKDNCFCFWSTDSPACLTFLSHIDLLCDSCRLWKTVRYEWWGSNVFKAPWHIIWHSDHLYKHLHQISCSHPDPLSFLTYITALSGVSLLTDAALSVLCHLTLAVQTLQTLAQPRQLLLQVTQRTTVSFHTVTAVSLCVQCHTRTLHTPGLMNAMKKMRRKHLTWRTNQQKHNINRNLCICYINTFEFMSWGMAFVKWR